MDGAFVRKLAGACRFIPLRHGLRPDQLPSLLQGYYSPAVEDYEADIEQLISDIHGINRKPPLGEAPPVVQASRRSRTGLSPAATGVVRLMVERSETGDAMDPQLTPDDVRAGTGLSDDDIVDAVDELHGLSLVHPYASAGCDALGFYVLTPKAELFVRMDPHWKSWNPEADALRVAANLVNGDNEGGIVRRIAERYGWEPRRMNPAVNYLVNRRLVEFGNESGTHPWSRFWIRGIPATRRFVRDRL